MDLLKNILFPTDFTKDADQAFQYAVEVASKTGAHIHLLHAVEEPYDFAVRVEETVQELTELAEEKLTNIITDIRESETYGKLSVSRQIKRGKPYRMIMNSIKDLNIDLIIMGTKGESSLKRILYGNVTSKVILDSPVPILTVPANSKKPYLDRFIFATDLRSKDLKSLQTTVNLARLLQAEVCVFHVSSENNEENKVRFHEFEKEVLQSVKYEKLNFQHVIAERFTQGLSGYINENPVSLVVITRYKKVFLKTMLWANATQELTYHTHVPMLVLVPDAL